jgi:hypothetical protein
MRSSSWCRMQFACSASQAACQKVRFDTSMLTFGHSCSALQNTSS